MSAVEAERLAIINANAPEERAQREANATAVLFARLGQAHPWAGDGA